MINPPSDPCYFVVFAWDMEIARNLALHFIVEQGLSAAFCDYVKDYEKDEKDELV